MGQYIMIGVCTKLTIWQENLRRHHMSAAQVAAAITARSIDLSLYDQQEDSDGVTWTLRRGPAEDGLVEFLRSQLAIMKGQLSDEQVGLLGKLAKCRTYDEVLAVVKIDGGTILHHVRFEERFAVNERGVGIPGEIELLVYLTEGKALLECYNKLFRYIEKMIALQHGQFPLAAAVRVCIV